MTSSLTPRFPSRNGSPSLPRALALAMLTVFAAPAWGYSYTCEFYAEPLGNNLTDLLVYEEQNGTSNSFKCGSSNEALGDSSQAFGRDNSSSGFVSNAFGTSNTSSGEYSSAFGYRNTASGKYSSAFGYRSIATAPNSTALGSGGQVLGAASNSSIAIGAGFPGTNGGGATVGTSAGAGAQRALAVGYDAIVLDGANDSMAIGTNSKVNANVTGAVAIGRGAVATESNTVSVGAAGNEKRIVNVAAGTLSATSTDAVNGSQLYATDQNAALALANLQTAVNQLLASGVCGMSGGSISCGNNLSLGSGQSIAAGATNAVVLGTGAQVVNPSGATTGISGTVAIGYGAVANADPSVAIGNFANASGADAVAVGDQATATGDQSVALGFQAQATAASSVALGAGSIASQADTVSVGSAGNERRITNVATPVNDTDAANKAYVDSLIGNGGGGGSLSQANAYADQRYAEAKRYAARGVAASMATVPQVALAPGETGVGVGVGNYGGQSAIGAGIAHFTNGGTQLNLGLAMASGGEPAVRVGAGWKW